MLNLNKRIKGKSMTKILKNVLISCFGIFAFLFAGFFFVGCGINYNKIQLVCDQSNVYLEVGQSAELTFTIENFQNGFSNKIDLNRQSSGMTEIFSCSKPIYLEKDKIKVTVTGMAGGNGQLEVKTLEAGKTCVVNISVGQYSNNLSFNNRVLYVSNTTPFIPSSNLFEFDTNTTHKDLSYYYIEPSVVDFSTFSLQSIEHLVEKDLAVFSDGVQRVELEITRFDTAKLEKDAENSNLDILKIYNNNEPKTVETNSKFEMLAVYDFSLTEDGTVNEELYEEIVYDVSSVYVLPDLKVNVSGGYVDPITNIVDFQELNTERLRIVPNNKEMNVYIAKIEMTSNITNLPIEFKMARSNNFVDIDFLKEEDYLTYFSKEGDSAIGLEKRDNIYYLKITQNSQTQVQTDFSFEIFYNIAQGVLDESVNIRKDLQIDVEIAPIDLLVNGSSEPEKMTLYNYYKFPEYGWEKLNFEVVSGLEASPNFNGIYFVFDQEYLELSCEGVAVTSGNAYLYKDLSKTFYVRGAYDCKKTEEGEPQTLKVCLESDILEGGKTEIDLVMNFDIVAGARNVWVSETYADLQKSFYLESDDEAKPFVDENGNGIIASDAPFQYITYSCDTQDVVDITFDRETVCQKGDDCYYLNFKISPKKVGSGIYTIHLDNGMPITLTFTVLEPLTTKDNPFALANSGNEAVTDFEYTSGSFTGVDPDTKVEYNNILNIDILNPTTKGEVVFGSRASLNVVSNIMSGGVKFNVVSGNIYMSQGENVYHFSTRENGKVVIMATLTGYNVDERFARQTQNLRYEIRVASYSLLQEFYLKNGEEAALSSTVYYGQRKGDDQSRATFSAYVDNSQTYGFYKYDFSDRAIINAYENTTDGIVQTDGTMLYKYNVESSEISYEFYHDFYNNKYIYYYAQSEKVGVFKPTILANIVKNNDPTTVKTVQLAISSGLMFYPIAREVVTQDSQGNVVTYTISFDELAFYEGNSLGSFNIETITYSNLREVDYTLRLDAYVTQRDMTKQYEVRIRAEQYQSIESISLASSLTAIDFDNEMREYSLDVYTYPHSSTNKNIEVIFETTNGTQYSFVSLISKKLSAEGVYTVTLSCEDFYKNPERYHKDYNGSADPINVVDIDDMLSGKIYIFPSEWGESVSDVDYDLNPIEIEVRYRNGSKNNPYLIETADDLKKINQNETTLQSHYEVKTVIDMANVIDFTPIGILNGEVVGFGGSLVGENAQATIANIFIEDGKYSATINETIYAGLFARINEGAVVENIHFTGHIEEDVASNAYVGLLAGANSGTISNVGATLDQSTINCLDTAEIVYFGGLVGINAGTIGQDFDDTFTTAKTLVYFNDFATINLNQNIVYVGGIAGASSGTITRVLASENASKFLGYAAYSAFTQLKFTGNAGDEKSLHAGGAVGISSFAKPEKTTLTKSKWLPISKTNVQNKLNNLLVGGEIDTRLLVIEASDDWNDYVGGIVGYIDSVNVDEISISNNISRIFLRAYNYVGGIVGYDFNNPSVPYDIDKISVFSNNKLEAIDDGRSVFESAMIIKFVPLTIDEDKVTQLYAVGNVIENHRDYSDDGFNSVSYSLRQTQDLTGNDDNPTLIAPNYSNLEVTYGDYIIVKKDGSEYKFIDDCHKFSFDRSVEDIGIDKTKNDFVMTNQNGEESGAPNVYFMYYFSVDGYLNKDGVVDSSEIEPLNTVKPREELYPFALTNADVIISSSNPQILTINKNGDITVKQTGLAVLEISSIKNLNNKQKLFIYVVNYFNKDSQSSLFYPSKSSNAINLTDGSKSVVYGDSKTSIYMVPSYKTQQQDLGFKTPIDGVINYKGVDYVLSKNTQLTAYVEQTQLYLRDAEGNVLYQTEVDENGETVYVLDANENKIPILNEKYFSKGEVINQTIVFSKVAKVGDLVDEYLLVPRLQITFKLDDKTYTFVRDLVASAINIDIEYREKVTQIYTDSDYASIKSNESFEDRVTIQSANPEEMLYYQIFFDGELIQERYSNEFTSVENWKEFVNFSGIHADNSNEEKFFAITINPRGANTFDLHCEINQESNRYLNRFTQNIYGEYVVHFFASDLGLDGGVSTKYVIDLQEAEVNYVKVKNYSKIEDVSVGDDRVIPSQRGLLEIDVDPIEAVFDKIVISNSELNYQTGATEASLTFVYEKVTSDGVEYVLSQNFGTFKDGELTFSYLEMIDYIKHLQQTLNDDNTTINDYNGKIFVSYFMPSNNVSDMVPVGFDVDITYAKKEHKDASVVMTTKLGNYAKLVFDSKQNFGGVYYLARGLSYGLTLQYHGFDESEITVTSSDADVAPIVGENGKYTLQITSGKIPHNDDIGYKVTIETLAIKVVDNVPIITKDILTIYVMEYTLNYTYVEGVNEDIVKGMQDGVISTAVGNPYTLEFDIFNFLEFDNTNKEVVEEVYKFAADMTQKLNWKVYYEKTETDLRQGKAPFRTDYYSIDGLIVTPLKIYSAESDIYHFSMDAYYTMKNGEYYYSAISTGNRIYTEFAFDVHNQSTEDSPIPVYNYDEFLSMEEGQWYILMNDIKLLSQEDVEGTQLAEFKPITTKIAGLDGNSKKICFGGTYNFEGLDKVGVFESVSDETILKNITIDLSRYTVFKMNQTGFNVGVLAAENDGIVTNCVVQSASDSSLSVVSSVSLEGSCVAGLIATNDAYITHSRSMINILTNANLSGFVALNNSGGVIASSYYKNGYLKNATNTTEKTAGFVLENSGRINTSYVSGQASAEKMYYYSDDTENSDIILSSYNIAGFAYTNTGNISDCYSNIMLKQSGAFAAGFVFENSGEIARSFSTSVFESAQSSNYGFVRINYIGQIDEEGTNSGTINDCYYLQDKKYSINTSIGVIENESDIGLKPMDIEGFKHPEESKAFENYVYSQGRDANGVWFFNEDYYSRTNFGGQEFNTSRLELVAPNMLATSERILDRIESVTDESGATYSKYIYVYKSGTAALGSAGNPITITCAEDLEEYIIQENNNANFNDKYYRLVADIDYDDYLYNSKTYTTKFIGYFEGNFMTIDGISFVSSQSLKSAGLFAEIGSSEIYNSIGTVMNFTLKPNAVSFSNASLVGALAGRLDSGRVYNVNIEAYDSEQLVVVGQNIVGGAIGLAIGNYEIVNLYSQLSAKARNQQLESNENAFNSLSNDYTFNSFAGGIVGILSGAGRFVNGRIDTTVAVLADKAGLMFGFIDQGVEVNNLDLYMNSNMIINAYSYGGLIVGESKGLVSDVIINHYDETSEGYFTNFRKVPFMADAVGGFAGLVSGGSISDLIMNQDIQISSANEVSGIKYFGGVAGMITNPTALNNITVTADLEGFHTVGGIVGKLSSLGDLNFVDINVDGILTISSSRVPEVGIGGIVGEASEKSRIVLNTSAAGKMNEVDVAFNTNLSVYSSSIVVNLGAIVGKNSSIMNHVVADTNITLIGTGYAYDYGFMDVDQMTDIEVYVDETGELIKSDGVDETVLKLSKYDADNSTYYCDIIFHMTASGGNKLNLSLFGEEMYPEGNN